MENTTDVNTPLHPGPRSRPAVILAGDIGATHTRLGLFDVEPDRPHERHVREFRTAQFAGLTDVVAAFLQNAGVHAGVVRAATFGVAGPVLGDTAELTNVPFTIDALAIKGDCGIPHVALLNDLESMAWSVRVLRPDELHTLQSGVAKNGGSLALIAAGTGLGQASLPSIDGSIVPCPTEAGHADWAARTDRDIALWRFLVAHHGRAEVEHVVSGIGLRNLHRATHTGLCAAGIDSEALDAPAALTTAALQRQCDACVEALEIFVDAYGAEAGNLALRALAVGGVFIGGGIAPKILPALTDGRFLRAFNDKGAMRALVERVPVHVILNADAGLLGAAVRASKLAGSPS